VADDAGSLVSVANLAGLAGQEEQVGGEGGVVLLDDTPGVVRVRPEDPHGSHDVILEFGKLCVDHWATDEAGENGYQTAYRSNVATSLLHGEAIRNLTQLKQRLVY
jgi:hypothetical protein